MSERRTLLSRPRTRVYDCNYNAGEKYYKPMVDQLDRKYSAGTSFPSFSTPTSSFSSRIRDDDDFPSARRSTPFSGRIHDDDDFPSPRRNSPFGRDFETQRERRSRFHNETTRSLEDDLEDEIVNSMRKLKVLRAAKAVSVEEEPIANHILNGLPKHKRLNMADKILETVGVNGRMQDTLEDEILKRRTIKMPSMFDDEPPSNTFTKWSKFRDQFDDTADTAKARARQSRARIADIESEIDAVTQKGLAREKRISNLKSLIAGEDPFFDDVDSSSIQSKKMTKSVKKVTF